MQNRLLSRYDKSSFVLVNEKFYVELIAILRWVFSHRYERVRVVDLFSNKGKSTLPISNLVGKLKSLFGIVGHYRARLGATGHGWAFLGTTGYGCPSAPLCPVFNA